MTRNVLPQKTTSSNLASAAPVADYEFPCTQGMQCQEFYWMSTFTFQQAQSLFQPFFDRVSEENPLDLAQRTLDRRRSQKFADYLVRGLSRSTEFYIMPPIIVTLDIPADECYEFQAIDLEGRALDSLGILKLPPTTTFWIPDGQHRAFGALMALRQAPGLVQAESFGVKLMPDAAGQKRQRIFLDINQHGMKPNKSIISLFDYRDESSNIAREVLTHVPVFRDRTALEATNLKSKSGDFFTMNALRESCKLLTAGYEGDRQQMAIDFWQTIATHHPDWQQVGELGLGLRQSSISFLALTLNALASVGAHQRETGLDNGWVSRLANVDWSIANPNWDGLCWFGGRIVKNNLTIKALAQYLLDKTGF